MARSLKTKELKNTKLANNYGGWIYCEACGTNIGYLCYVTYDQFSLAYECKCGNKGSCFLEFVDTQKGTLDHQPFHTIKNRSCCPIDDSPLFTILSPKLKRYQVDVVCTNCHHQFMTKTSS